MTCAPAVMYRYSDRGGVLRCESFNVIRHTPCGVVVNDWGNERFVRNDSRKRFAHETKEAALASYIARKNRQIRILSCQLEAAKNGLRVATTNTPDTLRPHHELTAGMFEFS